jgi:hypothetical protein
MTVIFNAYFSFKIGYNEDMFRNEIIKLYKDKEKIRLIIDLENRDIGLSNLGDFKKIKKIFDDLGVEKLLETIIICKDGIKKNIIKGFMKIVPTKRPVKFV